MTLTNDDRLILLGLKEAPIVTFNIGSPIASNVTAKLYESGLLEFEGSGNITTFSSSASVPWYNNRGNITSVSFKKGNTIKPTSTAYLFSGLNKVTSVDLTNLNTSSCNSMKSMFSTCSSLTEIIGLEDLDTSNVTDVSMMFEYCRYLTSLDLSLFDMSEVTTTDYMFMGCNNLSSSITIGTSSITSYSGMFSGCSTESGTEFIVYYIDSNTKTTAQNMVNTKSSNSNVILKAGIFKTYEIGNPVTSDVIATLYADGLLEFTGNGNIKKFSSSASKRVPWFSDRSNIYSVSFKEGNTIKPTSTAYLFYNLTNAASIDLSNLDTSEVTDIDYMFWDCSNLTSLDLSSLDTSNVTGMEQVFNGCNKLVDVNLSNWDTSNVTKMPYMFYNCRKLVSLDLSSFNTTNVTSMGSMFMNCYVLTSIEGLSDFDTSNVTSMAYMFSSCRKLTSSITIMNPNITSYDNMFSTCSREDDSQFIVHYKTGCETIAQNMVNTKGTGTLAGRVLLGFNIDLITKDSSVSTEITPTIINIIADCAVKQWGYTNTLNSIKSIKITSNDQTYLEWTLTYVSDSCTFLYDYGTKTYTCKQSPAPI